MSVFAEEPMVVGCLPSRAALAVLPGGHHAAAVTQAAALEQLRETLQAGEPPLKKMVTAAGEQQRMVEQNLIAVATQLPLKIKVNSRGETLRTGRGSSTFRSRPSLAAEAPLK